MNSKPKQAPRGKSLPPGNKLGGRKPGSKNKSTIARMELEAAWSEKAVKQILNNEIQKALEGNEVSIKYVMERKYPVPRIRSTPSFIMDIPSISTPEERLELRKEIIIRGARGDFPLEDGQLLLDQLGTVTTEEVNNKLRLMHDAIVNRSPEALEKLKLLKI